MFGILVRIALFSLSLLAGLGGCTSRTYYSDVPEPNADPAQPRNMAATGGYTVQQGDSLYLIAFSLGSDWRELAAVNSIAPPYTIYPGQILRLGVTAPSPQQATAAPVVRTIVAPDAGGPISAAPSSPVPVVQASPVPVAPSPPASTPVAAAVAAPLAPPPRPGAWQWPSAGRMIRGFSGGAQPHKGVDIEGRSGDPVLAANSGIVVYAGNGVRGYGNLVIVKHDATFLSAYAHNSRLLVKEGDVVKGGEKIAEIGDSGTDRFKLHFEVRKQGNPIDPLTILPRR